MKRVELYRGRNLKWRWRVVAANGQVTSGPGQAFYSRWNAKRSAHNEHPDLPIVVV